MAIVMVKSDILFSMMVCPNPCLDLGFDNIWNFDFSNLHWQQVIHFLSSTKYYRNTIAGKDIHFGPTLSPLSLDVSLKDV